MEQRHKAYRGLLICRSSDPGYKLPYTCYTDLGMLASDTLAGMKRLIDNALAELDAKIGGR